MRTLLVILFVVAVTVPAVAQDHRDLGLPSFAFAMGAAVDWAGTAASLQSGHTREWNPLINWRSDHPNQMLALGAGIDAGELVAIRWAATHWHHERAASVLLYGLTAFRVSLGVANFRRHP